MDDFREFASRLSLKFLVVITIFGFPIIFFETSIFEYLGDVVYFFYFVSALFTIDFILLTFSHLYDLNAKSIIKGVFLRGEDTYIKANKFVAILISFYFTITVFALAYLHIGYKTPFSFKDKEKISYIDAIYFSLTTITVGPSGLEPNSDIIRLIVIFEILTGLVYAFLVFSLISDSLRKRHS